jgi:putative ABC transport system permease protein
MSRDPRSPSRAHWRAAVRRRAAAGGHELPDSVIEELALHLEDAFADAVASGATPAEARARAEELLSSSDLPRSPEWGRLIRSRSRRDPRRPYAVQAELQSRAQRRPGGLALLDALRVSVRQLRKQPQLALITVLVLGLGVGAATAVFSVADAVLLQPLPYHEPDRLVSLWDTNAEEGLAEEPISPVSFVDYRALPVFEDAAAWWRPGVNLVDPGLDPVRVPTLETTPNLFRVLGVTPQIGAGFEPSGEGDALFVPNEPVVTISDRLWRQRYGADPSIVGRPLTLNDRSYTVVGVMPPGFRFPDDVDVWQRLDWDPAQHSRHAHFMEGVARLAPGTSLDEARAAADSLALRLGADHPDSNAGWRTRLEPLLDDMLGYYRPALLVLLGAVVLLLAIAVLNVASLLLTRALDREREVAIRISAGASPRHLLIQFLSESLVLSLAGAVVGLASAALAIRLLIAFAPVEIPRLEQAAIDPRALGVGVLIVALTTLVFGLVPSHLLIRRRVGESLRTGGDRGSSRRTRRLYGGLVAGEVAFACVLLVGSALLVRSVHGMLSTDLGIDADEVVTTPIQLNRSDVDPAQELERREIWQRIAETHALLLDEIRRQPGVEAAGAANFLPFGEGWRVPFAVDGGPVYGDGDEAPQVQIHSVSDGWFETLNARIAAGRPFEAHDTADAPPVVVINRSLAERWLPEGSPLGQRLRLWANGIGPLGLNLTADQSTHQEGMLFEVVGVVEDVRNVPLGQATEPAIYFSTRQFPFTEQHVAVRAVDRRAATAAIRSALDRVAPAVPVDRVATWGDQVAARAAEPRLLMWLLTLFGVMAALLAAAGVYGLFSWSVATRRRELAIRLTLGAGASRVARLIAAQSALLVGGGLAAGLVLVVGSRPALDRVVYGISPTDAASTVTAAGVLLLAAGLACVPPLVRAMRVDPVEGLRAE